MMLVKKVNIVSCRNCPHVYEGDSEWSNSFYCTHIDGKKDENGCKQAVGKLDDIILIPKWCPLEDAE